MKASTPSSLFLTFSLIFPSSINATDTVSKFVHDIEKAYIDDCSIANGPNGFYAAFLQPCEFRFYNAVEAVGEDTYSCDGGTLLGSPIPVSWTFKYLESGTFDNLEDFSSDDIPDIDELMLWPDQCVGVGARCYSLEDSVYTEKLEKLFPDGIPEDSTHVSVDCRADAMALSRVVYAAADGFEQSLPTLVVWALTVVLFALVASMWCCYGCCYLFCGTKKQVRTVTASPAYEKQSLIAVTKPV